MKVYIGKKINDIKEDKSNCLLCKKGNAYKKEDKYIEAVVKLYEKEREENVKNK